MTTSRQTIVALAALAAIGGLLAAPPADAGRVFLGAHASASYLEELRLPPGTRESGYRIEPKGGGADIQIGYLLAPTVPLRLTIGSSEHDSSEPDFGFSDAHAMLEINRVWNPNRAVRPYLLAGLGGFLLHPTWSRPDIRTTGGAATAGAGLILMLSRRFSLDLNARAEFINWSEERSVIENPDGSTVTYESPIARRGRGGRFGIGLLWWI